MRRSKLLCVLLLSPLLLTSANTEQDTEAEITTSSAQSMYRLRTSVMGSSGAPISSTNSLADGTMGQPAAAGESSADGKILYPGFWKVRWQEIIVGEETPPSLRNELFQNYPNPFNPVTTIEFMIVEESPVQLTIFNVKGERIRCLIQDTKSPGRYSARWDGKNERGATVSTGVYFYRLKVGSFSAVKKMLLLR